MTTTIYLTPKQYAEHWGVHYNTVYNWINAGILPEVIRQKINVRTRYWIPLGTIPPRPQLGGAAPRIRKEDEQLPGQMSTDDLPPWIK